MADRHDRAWFDPAHRARAPLYLGFSLAGMLLICAGVYDSARASHRREIRADALAAELLGDAGPVLAMLDDFQARHEQLRRIARLCGLLTHPSPSRRPPSDPPIARDPSAGQSFS